MVSAFQYGFNPNPLEQTKYSTPGAMEQAGLEDLQVPWATSVVPAIWSNTETMGDIFKGSSNISDLNLEAIDKGETRLSPAELNARYPHVNFETPQYASTAKYMAERQSRIQNLEWLKEHSTVKAPGAMFLPEIGSYIAKSFTDPTELALMAGMAFLTRGASLAVPQLTKFSGAGLSYKMAGMVMPKNLVQAELQAAYLPLSARLSGRAVQGFAEEAFANAMVEPWVANASRRVGDDYTAMNSVMNVLVGSLTGSVFHTAVGAVADPFTRMTTENKLKSMAEYIALRANGEDGLMATAQNALPITTLSAQDIFAAKNVKITQEADGQFTARFADEQGLLRNKTGTMGRTPGDALRSLQFMYATKMNDITLFHQLNKVYGSVTPAKVAGRNLNPFASNTKLATVKNTTTIRKGTNKYKLNFESPVDRVFYAINKILHRDKNLNKSFDKITDQRETLLEALNWIKDNLGDTTEAEIRAHAKQVAQYVSKQSDKAFLGKSTDKAIKISAIIKASDFDIQPEFLSAEAWKKRLLKQKEILLGADKEAALNLLGEIYNADREIQRARVESLKATRSEIQKLISATEEQLRNFSERDLIRKNFVDSILAVNKNITEEQLVQLMNLFDIATGDFLRWMKENNVFYVVTKEEQLKTEKRLKQTIIEKSVVNDKQIQTNNAYLADPLDFFTNPEIYEKVDTTLSETLTSQDIDVLVGLKRGKYTIQEALYASDPKTFSEDVDLQTEIDTNIAAIDKLVQNSYATRDLVTYRGLPPMGAQIFLDNNLAVGQVIQAKGYLSTSLKEDVSIRFANDVGTTQPVRLKILIPRGMKALDVDATLARNLSNSKYSDLLQLSREKLDAITDMDEDFQTANLTANEAIDGAFLLTATGTEAEIMLPRDVALKVLDIKQNENEKLITVTPDATLNNLYGSNILRENVDLFFNKVQEMNQNYKAQLAQLELGTPEHKAIATEAFFNGYILSDETINAYPELRIARDLTQEIPGSWLMQATNKESLANRIVGEFMQDVPLETFNQQYGWSYVYALGNGKYTKSPAYAIKKTGKAVLYEIPAGPRYDIDSSFIYSNILEALVDWEPALKQFLDQGEDVQFEILRRLAADAYNFLNKSGVSFLQYLDAMNLTNRKKVKKQTEWGRLSFDDNMIIYPLKNVPGETRQIGEVKVFEGMSESMMETIDPEVIYKSVVGGEINKVENLQTEVLKLQKEQKELKKQEPTKETPQNQLAKNIETQAKKIKKAKKELEKAKNIRETKINKINSKSEPYNEIIKGAVDVGTEGQYIVSLFQHADISTLIHETAHIFRRTVLDADMLEQAEKALGVKDGKWSVKNEEDFAVAFEKYLAEGKAPAKGLEALFEAFKSWLTQIYIKLSQSPMDQDFSPEIRKVFDQLFSEERVKMAEQAGYAKENITKQMYQNALTQHKDTLARINQSIKDTEAVIKDDRVLDQVTFAQFRQEKLARIQSKLNMIDTPDALTQDEIRDKMNEISTEVRKAENEYAEVAENQLAKNEAFNPEDVSFYENELALAENSLMTYARTLGLTDEQIQLLLDEGIDDLKLSELESEAAANEILENALREFGNCARGEL